MVMVQKHPQFPHFSINVTPNILLENCIGDIQLLRHHEMTKFWIKFN